jgi:DNA-binding response OmpR family regulator
VNRPLIVLVDDDEAVLETTASALRADFRVESFTSAVTALEALERLAPDAIVSDIVMPRMGGFELRWVYASRFGARRTPFLFLSSLQDPDTIVAALDSGADDFVTKPVVPELLRARIRAALRRAAPPPSPVFRGDLARIPFVSLLQFCEAKGFTGELVIEAEGLRAKLPLRAGELDLEAADPWLDRLCALDAGRYVLRPASPDFAELERIEKPSVGDVGPSGRVSTVREKDKVLHLETELVPGATPMIVSLVLAGDTPVRKVRHPAPGEATAAELQALIDTQHGEVEASTHDRISAARLKRVDPNAVDEPARDAAPIERAKSTAPPLAAPTPTSDERTTAPLTVPSPTPSAPTSLSAPEASPDASRAAALVEDGFELFRAKKYLGALARWEAAQKLEPQNRTLMVNIAVARRKLTESE